MAVDVWEVGPERLLRNASGDFACPQCWDTQHGKVTPFQRQCPTCGVALQWPKQSIANAAHYRKPVTNGR